MGDNTIVPNVIIVTTITAPIVVFILLPVGTTHLGTSPERGNSSRHLFVCKAPCDRQSICFPWLLTSRYGNTAGEAQRLEDRGSEVGLLAPGRTAGQR